MTQVSDLLIPQILTWLQSPSTSKKPLLIALSGPQGSGKTTLTSTLVHSLRSQNLRALAVSIDDFYLPYVEQVRVFTESGGNPFWEFRGNPGTHDLDLLFDFLGRVKSGVRGVVEVPGYDKSLNRGRGDRRGRGEWAVVELPVDVVVLEGWCLGFKALCLEEVEKVRGGVGEVGAWKLEHLMEVQKQLAKWEEGVYPMLDCFIHIQASDIRNVYDWRWEQEETMRKVLGDSSAGMSREEVEVFVQRFMPLYYLGLPRLSEEGFFGKDAKDGKVGRHLKCVIDKERRVVRYELM
ncbi:hypothetical protein HDV05_003745 [Chytridiales sp. JEL 0842]|nr:hypothetical protein HDV05_003745 [Chytridiales sp. JEL 0842]